VRDGGDSLGVKVMATFAQVLSAWPDAIIAVDMPIGLPASGARICDRMARARLGPRRTSVFPAPLRPCLTAETHAEASMARRGIEAKGMSIQTWNIVPKIREVDALISPSLQNRVLEAHPELAFAAMSGCPLVAGKKTVEGRAARQEALMNNLPLASTLLGQLRPPGAAADDLLDAMATLWTADRYLAGRAERVPQTPALDSRGLRMEIWY